MYKKTLALLVMLCMLAAPFGVLAEEGADAAFLDFSTRLYDAIRLDGRQNPLVSPLSAYLALSMMALGAQGETAREIEAVLGMDAQTGAEACRALLDAYAQMDGDNVLLTANAAWVGETMQLDPAFEEALRTQFDALAERADFADAATVERLNKWVGEQTEGLIPEAFSSFDPDMLLLLVNTLYLNAAWDDPFDSDDNEDGPFHLADGSTVDATYMRFWGESADIIHIKDRAEGILLPYDGRNLAFLAVKPLGDATPDAAFIADCLDAMEYHASVNLMLPKFDITQSITLNDALKAMGMQRVFDENEAELAGIGVDADGNPSMLGRAQQEVVLRVDEVGTEAAAVTTLEYYAVGAAPPVESIDITLDAPFVYAVVDLQTGMLLFAGFLDNPAL